MYTYDCRNRYHLVRDYTALSSWPMLFSLAGTSLTTLLSWLAIIFISTAPAVVAITIISTSLFLAFLLVYTYSSTYYPNVASSRTVLELASKSKISPPLNVASAASFALLRALGPHAHGRTPQQLSVSARHLIFSAELKQLFIRLQLNREAAAQVIADLVIPQLTWPQFSRAMVDLAHTLKNPSLSPAHALGGLLLQPAARPYLRSHNLTEGDLQFAVWWEDERLAVQKRTRAWWRADRLLAFEGLGTSWAAGYTPFVDRFSRLPRGSFWDDNIYGQEEKLAALVNSLARQRQSNVLLVGDPGVGRLGIIRALAGRLLADRAHRALHGQRLIYINIGELIAAGRSGPSQLANVALALKEMEHAGNIIAVLDGLSSILSQTDEGGINLTDILVPFLSSGAVRVIVMTTTSEYHLRLKSNDQLNQYFETVLVPSLTQAGTLKRLALSLPPIEHMTGVFIPYQTMRAAVIDTASLLPHVPFPERAFDFLEEAIVLAQSQNARKVTPAHLHTIIARKVGVNLGQLKSREKERLLNLGTLMHRRLINQEQAVSTLSRAMIRARAQTRSLDRPIGTFLFLGPTGVGKTETAKTLAHVYFGSEQHLTRLDMSEFQGADAVDRLIGSAYAPVGRLTSLIAEQPFTVLLLDEFEKANADVHQIFLQVLDEGRLTDYGGRQFSFQHAIIIATSNAGAELIRRRAQGGSLPSDFANTLKEHILRENILRPELLNRFDAVVTFTPLTPDHIRQIAQLMLRRLNRRLDAQHGVTVNISDQLVEYLVKVGYSPEFGARPLNRAIQDTVEYAVAQMVLRGQTQPGQVINLEPAYLSALKS